MQTHTIPQTGYKKLKHVPISEFLPKGTQVKLAKKWGVSRDFVSKVVTGKRRHLEIYRDALNIAIPEIQNFKEAEALNAKVLQLVS